MSFRAVGLWRPIPRLLEIVVQDDYKEKAKDRSLTLVRDDTRVGFPDVAR